MPRCWAGCLAWITADTYPENVGKIVKVESKADMSGYPELENIVSWNVSSRSELTLTRVGRTNSGAIFTVKGIKGTHAVFEDSCLTPIYPPGTLDEVETHEELPDEVRPQLIPG